MNPNEGAPQAPEPKGFEALLNQNKIAEEKEAVGKKIETIEERIRENASVRNTSTVRSIRTFKGDVDESIATGKTTLVGIASAEVARRSMEQGAHVVGSFVRSQKTQRAGLYIIGGLLILLGAVGVYYTFIYNSARQTVVVTQLAPLVNVDNTIQIDTNNLSTESLQKKLIASRTGATGQLGTITGVFPTHTVTDTTSNKTTTELLTTEEFFRSAGLRAPSSLVRSLNSQFLFGIHIFDGNQPFLLLKINSYNPAFAGMLQWESSAVDTLGPLMRNQSDFTQPQSTTTPFATWKFEDIVYKNIDARALKNASGKILIVYAFPTQDTLIIASNIETIGELVTRLTNTHVVQ